jgi:hypothetical protein
MLSLPSLYELPFSSLFSFIKSRFIKKGAVASTQLPIQRIKSRRKGVKHDSSPSQVVSSPTSQSQVTFNLPKRREIQ